MERQKLDFMKLEPSFVVSWLSEERVFWNETLQQLNTQDFDDTAIRIYVSLIDSYIEEPASSKRTSGARFDEILNFALENYIPHHDSPLSDDLRRLRFNSKSLSQALVNYKINRVIVDDFLASRYESKYRNLIEDKSKEYEALAEKNTKQYVEIHDAISAENDKVMENIEAGKISLANYIEALEAGTQEKLDKIGQAHTASLSDIAKKVKDAIEASAPNEFWENKVNLHKKRASNCKWAAISLGLIGAAIVSLFIAAAFKDQDTTTWLGYKLPSHFYVAVSIIIGSAFVWALRVCVQLMMTNFVLESEALDKSTAIKTYIALTDQITDPEIVKEFHKSLLNVSKITITQDSNHPEIYKLLESLLPKKKDS